MQLTGYIIDGKGSHLQGAFSIFSASGELLAGPTLAGDNGYFELSANPGEKVSFAAQGYIAKVLTVPFSGNVQLQKPISVFAYAAVAAGAYIVFFSKGKRKKVSGAIKLQPDDLKTLFWLVGGILAFDTIKKILEALGFWKDADARALDAEASSPTSFWNPSYWQQSQQYSYAIDTATAEHYAQLIDESLGWFNDDESAIISVFHQLHTKANISFLAYVYANKYGRDLFTTLRGGIWPYDGLSDSDLAALNAYGKSLPDF